VCQIIETLCHYKTFHHVATVLDRVSEGVISVSIVFHALGISDALTEGGGRKSAVRQVEAAAAIVAALWFGC